MSETNTPWGQTTAGIVVIQGVTGPVIGAVVGVVITLSVTQPTTVNWGLLATVAGLCAVGVFLLVSLIAAPLRRLFWGSIGRGLKWLLGLRVTSRSKRDALFGKGFAARDAEVTQERKHSKRPAWHVTYQEGDDFIFLYNSGWAVRDVTVRADPRLFAFRGGGSEGFIKGEHGDNLPGGSKGKQIVGELTKDGKREGVTFEVSWIDQNGDPQPATGGDAMPSTVTLAPQPTKRAIQPTWQIERLKHVTYRTDGEVFVLKNGSEGFVASDVLINADHHFFTFMRNRELGEIHGVDSLQFTGQVTEKGRLFGVTFSITYLDVYGDEQTDEVLAQFGGGLASVDV